MAKKIKKLKKPTTGLRRPKGSKKPKQHEVDPFKTLQNQVPEECIDSIQIRATSYDPLSWQVVARFRDRTLPWGVGVDQDVRKAADVAIRSALGLVDPEAYYHQKKEQAMEVEQEIKEAFPSTELAWTKIEFEPYQGHVVVVCPMPGHGDAFDEVRHRVEVRHATESGKTPTKTGGRTTNSSSSKGKPPTKTKSTSSGKSSGKKSSSGTGGMTRTTMMHLWVEKFGKQPPSTWNKAALEAKCKEEGLV